MQVTSLPCRSRKVNGIDDALNTGPGGEIGIALATFVANDPEKTEVGDDDPTTVGIRGADSSKFDIQCYD